MSAAPKSAPAWPPLPDAVFSLKVFLGAMLAYYIASKFGLDRPYWAFGTAYITSNPLAAASTSKAFYRLAGTAVGGVVCVALVPNLVDAPLLLTLAVAGWTSLCLYLSLLDRSPKSYAFMLAGYTVALTAFSLVSDPANAFSYCVSRVEEILLGVSCAALVSRVVFPRHAGPILQARVLGWLDNAGKLAVETLHGTGASAKAAAERRRLAADAVDMRGFTSHIFYGTTDHRERAPLSQALQQRMIELLPLLSSLEDHVARIDRLPAPVAAAVTATARWIEADDAGDELSRAALDRQIAAARAACGWGWRDLVGRNLLVRLERLIELRADCAALRADLAAGAIRSPRSRRALEDLRSPVIHRDKVSAGMAMLTCFLSMTVTSLFWVLTGWTDGYTGAELSGVLLCLFGAMDNPIPGLKSFLKWMVVAMAVGLFYECALLPKADTFLEIAAMMGLFLIPAGVLMGQPKTMMIGLPLCVNFPFMITVGNGFSFNMASFLNVSIASAFGIAVAIPIAAIIRVVGAETSARRLMRQHWQANADLAAMPGSVDQTAILHRAVDLLGLIAPRVAQLSKDSGPATRELLRDARVELNLAELHDARRTLPRDDALHPQVDAVLDAVAEHYRYLRRHPAASHADSAERAPAEARVLAPIDTCLAGLIGTAQDTTPSAERAALMRALAGLRMGLAPHAGDPDAGPVPTGLPAAETNQGYQAA